MISKSDLNNLLDFSNSLVNSGSSFTENVVRMLTEIFSYDLIVFYLFNNKTNQLYLDNPAVTKHLLKAIDPYREYYYDKSNFVKIYYSGNMINFNSKVIPINSSMSDNDFLKGEYYLDFLKKFNVNKEVVLPLNYGNKHMGILGIFKNDDDPDFSSNEIYLLGKINEIVTLNLKVALDNQSTEKRNKAILESYSTLDSGFILADQNFSLIHSNEKAREYCAAIMENKNNSSIHSMEKLIRSYIPKMLITKGMNNNKVTFKENDFSINISPTYVSDLYGGYDTYYSITISPYTTSLLTQDKKNIDFGLTKRELEIVDLLGKGFTNKQISENLYLSKHTVRTHIQNIYSKTGVKNRTSLLLKINS